MEAERAAETDDDEEVAESAVVAPEPVVVVPGPVAAVPEPAVAAPEQAEEASELAAEAAAEPAVVVRKPFGVEAVDGLVAEEAGRKTVEVVLEPGSEGRMRMLRELSWKPVLVRMLMQEQAAVAAAAGI